MSRHPVFTPKTKTFLLAHILPLIAVLLLGGFLTQQLHLLVKDSQDKIYENNFRINARERIAAIHHEIDLALSPLVLVEAFFASSQEVEENEFANFTFPILSRFEEIVGIGWIKKMSDAEYAIFESGQNTANVFYQKEVNTAGPRTGSHYPVILVQPEALKTVFKGKDLSQSEFYSEILKEVQDKGAHLTRFAPRQKAGDQYMDLIVVTPFYVEAKHPVLASERRRMLLGFLAEWIDFDKLIGKALRFFPSREIYIKIVGIKNGGEDILLYSNYQMLENARDDEAQDPIATHGHLHESRVISLEDEKVQIICFPATDSLKNKYLAADMVWQMGAFITVILAWILHLLLTRTESVQSIVDQRTQELKFRTEEAIRAYLRLKPEIEERKEKEEELQKAVRDLKHANVELEKFNKLMIGRELKMVELKKRLFDMEKKK